MLRTLSRVMRLSLALLLIVVSVQVGSTTVIGQDEPKRPAGGKKPASNEDVLATWAKLVERQKSIIDQMVKLQGQLEEAQKANNEDLSRESFGALQKLAIDAQTSVQPKMMRLAPEVLKQNPQDVKAAELVAGMLIHAESDYPGAIAALKPVIKNNKANVPVLTLAGLAEFCQNNFDSAKSLLERAGKSQELIDVEAYRALEGPQTLQMATEYAQFWAEEQAIRAEEAKADDLPRVEFKTNKGSIILELFENDAPNTVANFISLVEKGKYDGIAFHRVIPNFMAQGGDPNTLDDNPSNDGGGGPGYTIACECWKPNIRRHFAGSLSMAHAGRDTGGSQFFLTHRPTAHLNASKETGTGHTVFGRVLEGMDIVRALKIGDKIETATVLRKRDHAYTPKITAEKKPLQPLQQKSKGKRAPDGQ